MLVDKEGMGCGSRCHPNQSSKAFIFPFGKFETLVNVKFLYDLSMTLWYHQILLGRYRYHSYLGLTESLVCLSKPTQIWQHLGEGLE